MALPRRKISFAPVAQTAGGLLEPLLRKKAGLNLRLIENWPEIIGADLAEAVLPLKIIWPRQSGAEVRAGGLAAGQLVLAAHGFAALQAQHKTSEIEARINRFFGYRAIDRIRIEQRVIASSALGRGGAAGSAAQTGGLLAGFTAGAFAPAQKRKAQPSAAQPRQAEGIKDEALRAALLKLAAACSEQAET